MVACDANNRPESGVTGFEAQVIIMSQPGKIYNGYTPVIDCHTVYVACQFVNIKNKMDRNTGKVLEESPEFIKTADAALIDMKPTKPMCVETFTYFPPLGSFAVRDMKHTIAVGVIKHITPEEKNYKLKTHSHEKVRRYSAAPTQLHDIQKKSKGGVAA